MVACNRTPGLQKTILRFYYWNFRVISKWIFATNGENEMTATNGQYKSVFHWISAGIALHPDIWRPGFYSLSTSEQRIDTGVVGSKALERIYQGSWSCLNKTSFYRAEFVPTQHKSTLILWHKLLCIAIRSGSSELSMLTRSRVFYW